MEVTNPPKFTRRELWKSSAEMGEPAGKYDHITGTPSIRSVVVAASCYGGASQRQE